MVMVCALTPKTALPKVFANIYLVLMFIESSLKTVLNIQKEKRKAISMH
jgi:hypothetical protein